MIYYKARWIMDQDDFCYINNNPIAEMDFFYYIKLELKDLKNNIDRLMVRLYKIYK
jgi:hypothetical protein